MANTGNDRNRLLALMIRFTVWKIREGAEGGCMWGTLGHRRYLTGSSIDHENITLRCTSR